MLDTRHPGHRALDTEAEARVRNRAVATKIEVPLVIRFAELVLGDPALKHFRAFFALPAADHLAVAVGRDQVAAQRVLAGAGDARAAHRVRLLEIERLDLRGHVMHPDRFAELL